MTSYSGLTIDETWYETLQGNILKPHGRNHHRLLLLTFRDADLKGRVRDWIRGLPITSFSKQLDEARKYRAGQKTDVFISFLLSASGYQALGYSEDRVPKDPSFHVGMKQSIARFGDLSLEQWDDAHRLRIDAVLLLADDDLQRLVQETERLISEARNVLSPHAVLGVDAGITRRDPEGLAREPFGFRDGLSNPLFLEEEIRRAQEQGGIEKFDSRAPKEIALVIDPNVPDSYGSYVVVQKLEQNVRAFRTAELNLADLLGLSGKDAERASASVVGRFRDGMPLSEAAASIPPSISSAAALNNFDYSDDPKGARCPFHAHVRKINDRGESMRTGTGFGDERTRRIVRRGFTFAEGDAASFRGLDVDGSLPLSELPESGLGTMFIAYQSSISNQFEHLVERFSNNPDYFAPHSGVDALIGRRGDVPEVHQWSKVWGDVTSLTPFDFGSCITLKGGEYLFAPSIEFLRTLPEPNLSSAKTQGPQPSTKRTRLLRQLVVERAFTNRKNEWFTSDMLPHVLRTYPHLACEPVIKRQAEACREMLRAMTKQENSARTHTYEIRTGELIVGTIPMGSVGLGKPFPGYLTDEEARASSLSNRDEVSVFAHTVPNFRRVLNEGLCGVIETCQSRLNRNVSDTQKVFFEAVIITCEAVIEYAQAFADLANTMAEKEEDAARRDELLIISEVCQQVPAHPARNFREALQCVWFVHLAETAFCAFNSLGRLDQVLGSYLNDDLQNNRITEKEAIELLECFLIKGAERINLNPTTLKDQDFLTFGTGIGTQPIYLDQIASCNNFIQNIVLGGVNRDGKDATNKTTLLFLKALGGVGLATPTVNVRMHQGSPPELVNAVDEAFRLAQNGHPILFNDHNIISGLVDAGIPIEEARDFAVAGCWEPMLHGKNSFIFGMVNTLRVLECALNEGTLFSSDPQFLRGIKQSWRSPAPDEYKNFEELMSEVKRHMQFFADKVALGTCSFYLLPSAMTPTPFMSMLLDGCLERGVDQSLGGADFNIIANIAFAVPNTANALASIKKFVFEEKRWSLSEVASALRANWGMSPVRNEYENALEPDDSLREKYFKMRRAFLEQGSKFGNNDSYVDDIMSDLMTIWYESCKGAEALARKAFLAEPDDAESAKLRTMANYPAPSFKNSLRPDITLHFTSGSGTFGQYSSMGKGVSASADGRAANDSLVPNCSPSAGTATNGLDAAFHSLGKLDLGRFGCAVVTDIRVDGTTQQPNFFADLLKSWVLQGGSMLTVSVLSTVEVAEMLQLSDRVRRNPREIDILKPYADRFCRVGGWNSGFICLPRPQQRDHLLRATW